MEYVWTSLNSWRRELASLNYAKRIKRKIRTNPIINCYYINFLILTPSNHENITIVHITTRASLEAKAYNDYRVDGEIKSIYNDKPISILLYLSS